MENSKPKYLSEAEKLYQNSNNLPDLLSNIQIYINNYLDNDDEIYQPTSILESRFTPAKAAFMIKMRSCGSIVNIAAEMLIHLGYELVKVHGSTKNYTTHAWLKVKQNDANSWVIFDPSQEAPVKTKNYTEKAICKDWEEIAELIAHEHLLSIS